MTKRPVQIEEFSTRAVCAVILLLVAGCADPARVVLYEERHGNTVSRSVVPPSKPTATRPSSIKSPAARPSPPVDRVPQSPRVPATVHTVRSGDTVYSVSQRYHVPIRGLITMNGLQAPYVLRSGQSLRLPKPRRHVVQPGDTIYGISRKYDVALSRLVQFNGIAPPYKIVVGHVLRLPDSVAPSEREQRAKRAETILARKPTVARPPVAEPSGASKAAARRAVPAAIPKPPPLSKRKFLLPVRGRLVSRFGPKGRGLHNDGVNIAAPRGTPVRAAENGIVVYSGNALLGFGNMVLLRHANGFMTAYAHNEAVSVARGDTVRRGQVIATVGSTGNVSSPQLHFEIRKGKRAIDPSKFLPNLSAAS